MIDAILFTGGGVAAALVFAVLLGLAVHLARRREAGFVAYIGPMILLGSGVATLLSGRNLDALYVEGTGGGIGGMHPAALWIFRLTSVVLVLATLERMVSAALRKDQPWRVPLVLLSVFVFYWVCAVLLPALLGATPGFSQEYLYAAMLGCGLICMAPGDGPLVMRRLRDAALVFAVVSWLLVPIWPTLVFEFSYSQGLVPGVPRFAGIAVHAISLALIVLLGSLCLWRWPYQTRWVNRMAWALFAVTMVAAQSKTIWLAALVVAAPILHVRHARNALQQVFDPKHRTRNMAIGIATASLMLGLGAAASFGEMGARLGKFLDSDSGARLMTFTGRDRIWAAALSEWERYPLAGYGPSLFDAAYRASIGMPWASHGHNQLIDTLARSGTVGALGLVLFVLVLTAYAWRTARATQGLSVAFWLLLMLRAVSEVPLDLFSYGPETLVWVLALTAVMGAQDEDVTQPQPEMASVSVDQSPASATRVPTAPEPMRLEQA